MQSLFLGLGKVNRSLAEHISGEKIAVVEEKDSSEQPVVRVFKSSGSEPFVETQSIPGDFDSLKWETFLPAEVFVSPGIDPRRVFFKQVSTFEVRELDFFCRHFSGMKIGITGTDGKSTFTTWLGEVLKRSLPHKKIFVGGNLSPPMTDALEQGFDGAVLEISSFQAERLKSARLDAGIILNLASDHLDRYDSIEKYFDAKWNLLRRSNLAFFPSDIEVPADLTIKSPCNFENSESIVTVLKKILPVLLKSMGGSDSPLPPQIFEDLPQLPHRLNIFKDSIGAVFVNDSKATTVHAATYGLLEIQKQVAKVKLILGGRHKGDDFSELAGVLRPQDEVLIYGEAGFLIEEHLVGISQKTRRYRTLKELLEVELSKVVAGEALQLSPGCSSYDEFSNFEERGDYFIQQVRRIRLF